MIEHHSQVRNQFYNIFDFNFMVLTKKGQILVSKIKDCKIAKVRCANLAEESS